MGVVELSKVTLILPRSELPEATKTLCQFEWFHPLDLEAKTLDPQVDSLTSRAFRVYIDLDELAKNLGIKVEPGVMDILSKGVKTEKEKFIARDWASLITKLEAEANPIIEDLGARVQEASKTKKTLSDLETLEAALSLVSTFNIDLKSLGSLKRLYTVFTIISTKDLKEVRNSLPEAAIIDKPLTRDRNAVLVIGLRKDAERIDRALRSFEVKPFEIPSDLPQSPSEAYSAVRTRLEESSKSLEQLEQETSQLSKKNASRILTLRETGHVAYTVLSQVRKPGELSRFAVVEGYIPKAQQENFHRKFSRWISVFEEASRGNSHQEHIGHGEAAQPVPTLAREAKLVKPFANITLTQGPPSYAEVDPTPLISLVFPIFYGLMFGDLGHGLVLAAFGVFLVMRAGRGHPIRSWGQMFIAAGVSAMIVGIGIGEIFGLGIGEFVHLPFHPLELVERGHERSTIAIEVLKVFLKFSVALGILHISTGLLLNVVNGIRNRRALEVYLSRLPLLLLYVMFVSVLLAFWAGGKQIATLFTSTNSLFLLRDIGIHIQVKLAASIALPAMVALMALMVAGRVVLTKKGLGHGSEGVGMAALIEFIELAFERIPGFLANTVSYLRIAVLLTVHAALLIALNLAWSLGLAALPLIIVGNLGIIVLEAMIVFIQDLRLHLYEWFTKFYEGTGVLYRKIIPTTNYVELEWEEKA
ncbi:MAG: hypothetical protein HY619_00695 [Thaumarchaeota archaeon]|nr:hypothetical protein [Nitrososphaerota archaeon]